MLGLTIVALRRGGWREPALFALVVALVSGINASSIIYVGVAPVLWLLYAVVVLRESTWRHALATALRIGVLTLGACVWWIAGLQVEAAYGVNVLKFTETVPSTSATSNPADIIRGLGYWYFYGTDHLGRGPTRPSATPRTSRCWRRPSPCRSWRWSRRPSCAGASAPTSSSSSSWAWCSRSGPSPSPTRPVIGGCSSRS